MPSVDQLGKGPTRRKENSENPRHLQTGGTRKKLTHSGLELWCGGATGFLVSPSHPPFPTGSISPYPSPHVLDFCLPHSVVLKLIWRDKDILMPGSTLRAPASQGLSMEIKLKKPLAEIRITRPLPSHLSHCNCYNVPEDLPTPET